MPVPVATTVTYLEMFEKPALLALPPPLKNYALLRAETPPVHFYRYLYHMVGRDHVWVNRKRMSDADLAEIIQDDEVEIYVFYVGGVPAGYFELDFRDMPDVELCFFGLFQEFTERGVGRFLLAQAIELAWRRDPTRFHVQTCTLDHPRALPLYQRMGFTPFAQETTEIMPLDDRDIVQLTPSE